MLLVSQIDASCLCGAQGTDYCSCSGVRPLPRLIEKGISNLLPIGDKCYCGQQVVEPAVLPKPCACAKPTCGCQSESEQSPVPYVEPVHDGPAADPVSIGLAYNINMAKQFSVPESKLSYGFSKLPLNGLPKVSKSNVPEEKLWKLNNANIIELRRTYSKPEEEEFEEPEEEVDHSPDSPAPYLSYGDLGYAPAAVKNPRFRSIVSEPIAIESPSPNRDYSCGFKPGQISNNADASNNAFLYGGDEDCFGRIY
ncbi:hypothetical protein ACFFRR_003672 [Megaselia abdita]